MKNKNRERYSVRIISTYPEYEIDESQSFKTLTEATRFCISVMDMVSSETTNERQKRFALLFKNNISCGQRSFGITLGKNIFAIDILDNDEEEKERKKKAEQLKAEIKKDKKELQRLKRKYKRM